MIYACTCTMEKKGTEGVVTMQLPTFYLDGRVQGITSENAARFIAEEIVNPLKLKTVKVHMHVMACDRSVWAA